MSPRNLEEALDRITELKAKSALTLTIRRNIRDDEWPGRANREAVEFSRNINVLKDFWGIASWVMASVGRFLTTKIRLTVNEAKSAVSRDIALARMEIILESLPTLFEQLGSAGAEIDGTRLRLFFDHHDMADFALDDAADWITSALSESFDVASDRVSFRRDAGAHGDELEAIIECRP